MTRPRVSGERFVADLPAVLRERLTVCHSPLLRIVPIAEQIDLDDARGLIFTSANGVAIAADVTDRRNLPCYCVGAWTTQTARKLGWQARMVGEDAAELIATLRANPPQGPLLHLRGRHGSGDIAGELAPVGCSVVVQVIYEQEVLPLTDAAQATLNGPGQVIVPLFSPRTAQQFARVAQIGAEVHAVAISEAAARPLRDLPLKRLIVASRPTAAALADGVEILANQASRVEGGPSAK
ncbi:uroporphyrinogen-III synthase [Pontibaca sp. S1109L]|uniref:Uroporphyrinogen-III synthase n=2 Tax=Pontibaca salina TaxID=2795731 RepID=A0A934HRR4_9RHOB|nr:uroporphyrinogen-III synthase [Pontibaca salina]